MTENDSDLLVQFTRGESEDAFSELVNRHLNLVYTAALRQVRSPELAEEISLSVFSRLATHAGKLPRDTIVTAWLYKVACNSAIDVIRRETRRQAREQIAFQMSALNEPAPDSLAAKLNLPPEKTDKMNDLLADHIMQNVDNVTTMLRDKSTPDQMNAIFNAQEAALQQQIQDLVGPDGLAQYQDYTRNLLATITADQFKDKLAGTPDEQAAKATQLSQLLEQQSQAVLAADGLPADYQTVPMLNFRNIVSEQTAAQGLQLLTDIYQQAAAHAGSFLSADDLAQFQIFQTAAINNNRAALSLNRTLMAPISN